MILKIKFLLLFFVAGVNLFSQDKVANVETIIRREMKEQHIPGLQVAIIQHGKIVLNKSYGIANMEDSARVKNETVFSIMSCTKVFTGVAIMQLVEDGKISLSAPISNYLDDLPVNWQRVTIRQLLIHVSGLPDIIQFYPSATHGFGALTEAQAWEKIKTMPMDFPTGEQTRYNQTNYVILGKIIDKISGKPFIQFFKERQFQPVGMPTTVFGDSRSVISNFAPVYEYVENTNELHQKEGVLTRNYLEVPFFLRTAGGVNSTAEELAKWIIALQQGKLFKKKATLDTLWTPGTYNNGTPTPWVLGWGNTKFRPKHKAIGMTGGVRSALIIYPDDNLAVVVLTNLKGCQPFNFIEEIASCYNPDIVEADPITFLRINLREKGFENAIEVVNAQKKKDPLFQPTESDLNYWGYRMIEKGQYKAAVEIFKLMVFLYPESSDAYDSYGEGLLKNGQKSEAVKMYKKALELNPKNENSKKVLEELSKQQ
ncbi:MAG TPA: serine hydrolase [Bacteroidia bacterium]|nr:serine hydrolase [Bacteroidia bacterium]